MKDGLNIKRVSNGYIVTYSTEFVDIDTATFVALNDSVTSTEMTIFEDKESKDEEEDLNSTKELLEFIAQYFGVNYSKHNKRNLVVQIEEGQ